MASKPKQSAGGSKRKPSAPAKSTPKAPKPEVKTADTVAAAEVQETQEPAREAAPRRTAEEWMAVCELTFNVKPRILRATVSGHAPGRKYTEDEIRRLIQRKLGEPA